MIAKNTERLQKMREGGLKPIVNLENVNKRKTKLFIPKENCPSNLDRSTTISIHLNVDANIGLCGRRASRTLPKKRSHNYANMSSRFSEFTLMRLAAYLNIYIYNRYVFVNF